MYKIKTGDNSAYFWILEHDFLQAPFLTDL